MFIRITNITRKNLSVCYTDLKTNQVLFFWTTPSSEITKTFEEEEEEEDSFIYAQSNNI